MHQNSYIYLCMIVISPTKKILHYTSQILVQAIQIQHCQRTTFDGCLGHSCKVVDGGSVASPCWAEVAWISDEEKKRRKLPLGPKICQNTSLEPQKWWMWWVWAVVARWWMVVVSCHFVESRWLGLAMKKNLRKLTLDPKMCQNTLFGPQNWWMWWVWVVVARWWMVVASCHLELRWLGLAMKKRKKIKKTYLGPKDAPECIIWAMELVDVMGLGCCCKVVDGGSIMSPWVEVAWISNEEKKKNLRKLTLGPKTCQNASFGPWKWWMWWVWVIVAKWWMVVVSCHLKLRWLGLATKKRNFF